jgi:hypothetical protein
MISDSCAVIVLGQVSVTAKNPLTQGGVEKVVSRQKKSDHMIKTSQK